MENLIGESSGASSEDKSGKKPELVLNVNGDDHILDPSVDVKNLMKQLPDESQSEQHQDTVFQDQLTDKNDQ